MNIWVPRTKIIEPNRQIVRTTRLRGFFKLEATDRRGRKRVLADWFPNLITDAGLNAIGTTSNWLTRCRVGTGSSAPDVTDTELDSLLAANNTQNSNVVNYVGAPDHYTSRTIVYRFNEGVATGNLAEVGIASTASGATLFSRALILDGGGSPTTITVLSDETLDVTYQIRVYPPLVDVTDTIVISGDSYDYTQRAVSVTNSWTLQPNGARGGVPSIVGVGSFADAWTGAIGAITSSPSGTQGTSSSAVDTSYGNNDLFRDFTIVWGLGNGNLSGGIRSISTKFGTEASFGGIQIEFDPVIPKNNTEVLSLVFRHIWARGTI